MDAKLAIRLSENEPKHPAGMRHQRHNSTGQLVESTSPDMAGLGAVQDGAKRSAFADLSRNAQRFAHDDLSAGGKAVVKAQIYSLPTGEKENVKFGDVRVVKSLGLKKDTNPARNAAPTSAVATGGGPPPPTRVQTQKAVILTNVAAQPLMQRAPLRPSASVTGSALIGNVPSQAKPTTGLQVSGFPRPSLRQTVSSGNFRVAKAAQLTTHHSQASLRLSVAEGSQTTANENRPIIRQPASKKAKIVYRDADVVEQPQHADLHFSLYMAHQSTLNHQVTVPPVPAWAAYVAQAPTQAASLAPANAKSGRGPEGYPADDPAEQAYHSAEEYIGEDGTVWSESVEVIIPSPTAGDVNDLPLAQLNVHGNETNYSHTEALPAVSEPEEEWDEDDEVDIDDDAGYTTGHSGRDNTTMVIVPRVTNKIRRELELAALIVEQTTTPEEIEEDQWDISMMAEYNEDIFAYMRELEEKMTPNPHYMDIQSEIQWSMRAVLMDWLVQVHARFNLLPETLYLTANYIDRFLSCKIVSLGKLQLVGATALYIAGKYEEINCPTLSEIVFMVDGSYSGDEIMKAERYMLSMLDYQLGWPGPMSFLRRISKADDYDLETRTLAKYFLELTIMDERFVGCPPSFLAAGAHHLARLALKKGGWTPHHVHYSGYTAAQLKGVVSAMFDCCQAPTQHHNAIFEKYSDDKYRRLAEVVQLEIQNGFTPFERPDRPRPNNGQLSPNLSGTQTYISYPDLSYAPGHHPSLIRLEG